VSTWVLDAPENDALEAITIPFSSGLAIAAAVVFTLFVGILPGWLLDAADVTIAFAR